MENKLIEYSTAKLAKEKGFNVETYKGYLSETIVEYFDTYPSDYIRPEGEKFLFIEFSTYEEALEIGLQEALKLI